MVIEGPKGLVKAATFYASLLGIAELDFHVIIRRARLDNGALGMCAYSPENDEYEIDLEPRNFDRNPDIYELLAHEMVHVKQYLRGELADLEDGKTLWNGKEHEGDDYLSAPWEIEAYGKQVGMHYSWCKHCEK